VRRNDGMLGSATLEIPPKGALLETGEQRVQLRQRHYVLHRSSSKASTLNMNRRSFWSLARLGPFRPLP